MHIQPFKVEEWMNEYEKYCKYDLGNTTVNTLTLEKLFEICEVDKQYFLNKLCVNSLGYGYVKGNPDFKKGISKLYKNVSQDEIITTIGTAGANHLVFYSLVEPEDEVISVLPSYQQLYSIPESFGANVKYLHLKQENNFLPDLEELNNLVSENTKLICLNNPNNPTGALMDEIFLKKIVEIAKKSDAYILCDEVYRGLNQEDIETPSIVDLYEKGISTSGMSKTFSLAGLRLGWTVSKDKSFLKKAFSHREYNMISCSVSDETVAALALENASKIVERNKKTIRENLKILDSWVKNEKLVRYVKPQAGTTALVFYDADISSKDLCDRLAKKCGVFLTPGFCFELEYCFRIGYCKDKEQLKKGLEKISSLLHSITAHPV